MTQQKIETDVAGAACARIGSGAGAGNALALLLIVGILLASSAMFAKQAPVAGWNPLALLQWSLLGAAILQMGLLAIAGSGGRARAAAGEAATGAGLKPSLSRLLTYMAVSGLLFALPNALAFSAVRHVGAGFVALCFAFPLVLTYGLSVVLGLDVVNRRRLTGVGLGVLGGAVLAGEGLGQPPETAIWFLAALAMPVLISFGNVYRSLYWPKGASPALLSAGMMAFGFVAMGVLNLGLGVAFLPASIDWGALSLLGTQIAVFTLLYALYFRLQKLAGPVYLSQIGSVAAIVGLAMAFVAFHEVPGPEKLAAAAVIATGIWFVSSRKKA